MKKNKKKNPCLYIKKKNIRNFDTKPINGGKPAIENKDRITVTEKNWSPENLLNSFNVKKFFISNTSKIENNKNSKYM